MGMDFKRRLPIPQEIKEQMPLPLDAALRKAERDEAIARVINGEDSRLLIVVGPCSADREDAVLDYCLRLSGLQEKVSDSLLLVPRVYTGKPRTMCVGYKGMIHQPDPRAGEDLLEGIRSIRHLHLRVLCETGMSAADELLYPQQYRFVSDLLSYVAVGARSVENQEHRLVASGLDIPVGMKNPQSGNFAPMVNAVFAARHAQTFIYRNWEVESSGNTLAHCILRGYSKDGGFHSNYDVDSLLNLVSLHEERGLENPTVIVDCNHSNSSKHYEIQGEIASYVLRTCTHDSVLRKSIKGFMMESYLIDGCNASNGDTYGQSITDPCMGWEMTYRVIMELAELVH